VKVAVASGKGGTGKTTVATSLALSWGDAALLDCDVEGPNAHLLLHPEIAASYEVTVPVPRVREELCAHCGECAGFCRYHSLAVLSRQWMVFDELCHSCGGCSLVCPTKAIFEFPRRIGRVIEGRRAEIPFVQGILDEGEAQAIPVIRAVLRRASDDRDVILDSPPGASCSMLAVAEASDVVLLVTEPTPFGLHDLEAAATAVSELGRPMAAVINRADWGDSRVRRFCAAKGIPVALEIPHLRKAAEGYARAQPLVESVPGLRDDFVALRDQLRALAREAAA